MERSGVIQIRLPAENAAGLVDVKLIDQEMPKGVQLVENILRAHQFSRMQKQRGQEESNAAIALQFMNAPNSLQPVAMPEEMRSTWVLLIDRRGDMPDKVLCSVYPTQNSELLQVSVTVEYVGRMPVLAGQFWKDLVFGVTEKYGADRVSTDTSIRTPTP
jgi:hypothetical protein